ncbi:MAG: glycosyltransferase family 4 protein [Actinobacteria bacterium]|nr:glycosyltransferase family 4 protein [Actinomycetota bacterium]
MFDIRIFHREARTLAQAGHEVVLIAPGDGASRVVGGVRCIAVPRARGRRERMLRTPIEIYRAARAVKADVYHLHDPELLPIGILLKAQGNQVVYDVHEDYPADVRHKLWLNARARPLVAMAVRLLEIFASWRLDAVVAATPPIARRFPSSKTSVVQNFPDIAETSLAPTRPYEQRPESFVYVGGISEMRGIREVVTAMGLLRATSSARLLLAGDFHPPGLRVDLSALPGWERVDVLGWLSREEVSSLLGDARAGIVSLHPMPNHIESYPIKLFEYMQWGLPIIASNFPLWKRLVADTGCGLLVDPLNPSEVGAAMQWILEHPGEAAEMGAQGRKTAQKFYSWQREGAKLIGLYERLAAAG